jgi:DNA-binding protein YbaB
MPEEYKLKIDELTAQYTKSREDALASHQRLQEVSETVTSKKGLVTVTVGAQGEIRSLTLNNRTYRDMAPAELSHVIVDTLKTARKRVEKHFVQALPSTVLGGMSVEDILSGKVDLAKFLPESIPMDGTPFTPGAANHESKN